MFWGEIGCGVIRNRPGAKWNFDSPRGESEGEDIFYKICGFYMMRIIHHNTRHPSCSSSMPNPSFMLIILHAHHPSCSSSIMLIIHVLIIHHVLIHTHPS
jgi:hypothetical protein